MDLVRIFLCWELLTPSRDSLFRYREFIGIRCSDDAVILKKACKTQENSNFLKKGKMVISIKIQNFSRSRMMKRTSPLESSREI